MIITQLNGGLGNQMFQYAIGRALALKNRTDLYLDVSAFNHIAPGDTPRIYELDCYDIDAKIASDELLASVRSSDKKPTLVERVARKLGGKTIWKISEGDPVFNPSAKNAPDNTYLAGYWQNDTYFRNYRDQIIQDFSPKKQPNKRNTSYLDQAVNCNSIALHVRRGDYVSNKNAAVFHGLAPIDYYNQAVAMLRSKTDSPRFFVFSDDLDWCKANLKLGKDAVFVEGNGGRSAYEDIRIMQHCKHNVIANSSFSWWGAWLNDNPDKIVIAPKVWFQDQNANSKTNIVPNNWIRL